MKLKLLTEAQSTAKGAVCLDGSVPGFYYTPANTSADPANAHKWVLYFKGGGWRVATPLRIPVIGSIARDTQRLNCSMHGSMEPRIEQFSRYRNFHGAPPPRRRRPRGCGTKRYRHEPSFRELPLCPLSFRRMAAPRAERSLPTAAVRVQVLRHDQRRHGQQLRVAR